MTGRYYFNLENRAAASSILHNAGINADPSFYSGYGATLSTLNSKILENVYQEIVKVKGKEAGGEFVKMVSDIPKLSATDFLLHVYRLEGNEWKWDKRMVGDEKGIYAWDISSGIGTIGAFLSGSRSTDETPYIRNSFLIEHGVEPPRSKVMRHRDIFGNNIYFGEEY